MNTHQSGSTERDTSSTTGNRKARSIRARQDKESGRRVFPISLSSAPAVLKHVQDKDQEDDHLEPDQLPDIPGVGIL